jgi:hypothetical protein
MCRTKGELSSAEIDRRWPYQVALPADQCRGAHFRTQHAFCLDLSLCPRGHSVFHKDQWWQVFCFAKEVDADAFRARFGGEHFDPKDRGRGTRWAQWNRKAP